MLSKLTTLLVVVSLCALSNQKPRTHNKKWPGFYNHNRPQNHPQNIPINPNRPPNHPQNIPYMQSDHPESYFPQNNNINHMQRDSPNRTPRQNNKISNSRSQNSIVPYEAKKVTSNNAASHDGHRMITRALWRIFDALMEKKDHTELYKRVNFIEEAIKDMITADTKLEDEIDKLKDGMRSATSQVSTLAEEVGRLKTLNSRTQSLEQWREQRLSQGDQHTADHGRRNQRLSQGDQQTAENEFASSGKEEWIGPIERAFSSCPAPFKQAGLDCYYLGTEERKGWHDARRHCRSLRGDLASPKDLARLRNFLTNTPNRPEYVWVGGTMMSEGSWVWTSGAMSGQSIDMSKETWNDGVPSGDGICMGLYEGGSYRAYDYNCDEKDFFVCQFFP